MGVLGELGGPFPSGSAAAKRLRVMERRYVLLALKWVQCPERANGWGNANGGRRAPFAKIGLYYKPHLAFTLNSAAMLNSISHESSGFASDLRDQNASNAIL